MSTDMNTRIHDGGTSSDSSASSPINGEDRYIGRTRFTPCPAFQMQFCTGDYPVPIGLIPVKLDIGALYEDRDRRGQRYGNDKAVGSNVHCRRRAQNRASQRAFRDRKQKHMRDLEQRLSELEDKHNLLSQSYDSLQLEYSSVKSELDWLRREDSRLESAALSTVEEFQSNHTHWEWNNSKIGLLDPPSFDVSAFCFDLDEGKNCKR